MSLPGNFQVDEVVDDDDDDDDDDADEVSMLGVQAL